MQDEKIKELYEKDYLTQKDIIQLLLHNAQHMVTRDELKEDNRDLKQDLKDEINKTKEEIKEDIEDLDKKIDGVKTELKEDIQNVKTELKGDINRLEKRIEKLEFKFDRLQWLIVATLVSIFLKDYIIELVKRMFG